MAVSKETSSESQAKQDENKNAPESEAAQSSSSNAFNDPSTLGIDIKSFVVLTAYTKIKSYWCSKGHCNREYGWNGLRKRRSTQSNAGSIQQPRPSCRVSTICKQQKKKKKLNKYNF